MANHPNRTKRFTRAQRDAQQLAWSENYDGPRRAPLAAIKAAHAALIGHPDEPSRDLLAREIERRETALSALRASL